MKIIRHLIQSAKSLFKEGEKTREMALPDRVVSKEPPKGFYQIIRGDEHSSGTATAEEVADFVHECHFRGLDQKNFMAAMGGAPFEYNGATIRFIRLPRFCASPVGR